MLLGVTDYGSVGDTKQIEEFTVWPNYSRILFLLALEILNLAVSLYHFEVENY